MTQTTEAAHLSPAPAVVDEIFDLFTRRGDTEYFGEPVSQKEHALQAAYFAEAENAPDTLVVAALLHDIGHLVHDLGQDVADKGVDSRHEELGEAWLAAHFPPSVTQPGKLHVAAKRYLCATDPAYLDKLSPASVQSLALQGGAMTEAEVRDFEAYPTFRDAVRLRGWDDRAKVPGLAVPDLEHYRERIARVADR